MSKLDTIKRVVREVNEAKGYKTSGKSKILKTPIDIGDGMSILALSRDTNGNALIRIEVGIKKKSIQYKQTGMNTIDIDELISGDFVKRRESDVKELKRLAK